ncbi:efflux transporter outer membrane subunit [Novosphingobium sp. KCTC 2891]|uniref:efflux transporter outer membrane subunit n=1 Tax=Novosphingobium sp. KCTC 2891 TaxID=2989730 RepID=UPI0039B51B90
MPIVLALAACAAGPDYTPPPQAALSVPYAYSVPADSRAPGNISRWWERFNDPLLTRLIDDGARANLDIAIALSRLRQSRESLIQARSGNVPTVGASVGAGRTEVLAGTGSGMPASNISLAVDASYQVDLFGGRGRGIEAARADVEASGFDYGSVILSVEAEIANNYMLARLQQAQLTNARQSLANQDDNLQIARWRNQAGLVGSLDVELARTQRAQTAATIPQLESSLNQSISRLGVLLGTAPGAIKTDFATPAPIPAGPAAISVGVPAGVLRQRPDVRSSERQLAAATARIGVAEAQLYPALSLGGTISTGASAFRTLFDLITGQVFANVAQTIFDGGRLRSQVRSQRAAADGAFAGYKQVVLRALEDTENAIVALRAADQRQADFRMALDAANNSAIIARTQYRSGLIDFTTLLGTENQVLASRSGLAQSQYDHAAAIVQLYTALGGGWDELASPPATYPAPRRDQP